MARVLSFLIRYFSNYYTLHRSDLAAQAVPLDPRLLNLYIFNESDSNSKVWQVKNVFEKFSKKFNDLYPQFKLFKLLIFHLKVVR